MKVVAIILDGAVTAEAEAAALRAHAPGLAALIAGGAVGAALRFEGIVRRQENDPERGAAGRIAALDYQTYDPMAERQLSELARSIADRHGLDALVALHSRGRVAVGGISFVLTVCSARRAAALSAMENFIDRLKKDVPIWKRAVWEE